MKKQRLQDEDGVDDVVKTQEPEPDLAQAGLMLQEAVALFMVGSALLADELAGYELDKLNINSVEDVRQRMVALMSDWQNGLPFNFKELAAIAAIGLSKGL
jgi:hypothetical protein